MKVTLQARSSSGGSYDVEFQMVENSVRVFCHCQAGILQQMCKHKFALIQGDASMLFDPRQTALLTEVRAWPQFSRLMARAEEYKRALEEIEVAKSQLTQQEKQLKARFARALARGFE